jgi:ABC-type dipeptide/oligopeptide/nickel transport system permease subunit
MSFPRPTYLRLLTGIQNTTALAFSTFLVVHLASPLVAAVAGGEGATNVMVRLPLSRLAYPLTVVAVVGQGILPPA